MKKLLMLVVITSSLFAGGDSGEREIKEIHQRECLSGTDKAFEIVFSLSHNNPDKCTNSTVVNISCEHKAYETIVSMVIASKIANKKMKFWLSGCDSEGQARAVTATIK